jgi:polyisoprenoid-binding protein YceI
VGFSISHLFTSVHGRFDRFEGTIQFDPEAPEATKVKVSIAADSINTNNAKRDKHLRSSDFFDAKQFSSLQFESSSLKEWDGRKGKLLGKLTIHGVSRDVAFDVSFLGRGKDPWGNVRAGFKASLIISRKDYGLNWNEVLETGGFLVGDEVEIRIDAEGLLE